MRTTSILALVVLSVLLKPLQGASPSPSEMQTAAHWAAAKFEGKPLAPPPELGLVVERNHDPVQKNARGGRAMRLGDKSFSRGLYFHAPSRVLVRNLPADAKTFTATIGVDSNEQTSNGRGSVVFSVQVDGAEKFKSDLMRENTSAGAVTVDVRGAKTIALQVDDGGDGISCDQADWVDARVDMADGSSVWLGDLPMLDADERRAISTEPFFSFTYGGKPSAESRSQWKVERTSKPIDANRIGHTVTWRDAATGLVVRCEGVVYRDFPTVEWTLFLRNEGKSDS